MILPKVGKIFGGATLGIALLLAGCSFEGSSPEIVRPTGDVSPGPDEADESLSPQDVAVEKEIAIGGVNATAHVYPVVRTGDYAVATIDFTGFGDEESVHWGLFSNDFGWKTPYMGIRLVDLSSDEFYFPALDNEGKNFTNPDFSYRGDQRLQLIYDAPDVESIGLFLPGVEYIEAVPIIEGEVLPGTIEGEGGAR